MGQTNRFKEWHESNPQGGKGVRVLGSRTVRKMTITSYWQVMEKLQKEINSVYPKLIHFSIFLLI